MTITMSALPRSLNCDGSLVFPRAENVSQWADSGNDEHEELARKVLAGTLPPRLARIVPPGARPEVIVAINVATGEGRIVGDSDGRNYGTPGPLEIFGKVDVIGVLDDAVVIIDWKTGHKDVDPAARNWQLWGYALAACRAMGKSKARIYIAYTNQPGQPIDEHELDALDLADFAKRLSALYVREAKLRSEYQRGEIPATREGSWCRHCASKSRCPSKVGLLVQVAASGLAVIGDTEMTADRARQAHEEIERLDQLVSDAKARRMAYVDEHGPIDLGNGKLYGRMPRAGNRILDGQKAAQAIREIVGESAREFEALALEYRTSQAAIKRAAQTLGKGQSPEKLKNQIVDRIEKLGGVKHGPDQMPLGEFPAGKYEKPEPLDVGEINKLLEAAG